MVHWGTQASRSEVRMKINEEIWSLMGCTSALPFTSNSNEHQNIYGRDDWSKNRNKTCKIQTKIFQQPQDIKRSEPKKHKAKIASFNSKWKSNGQSMHQRTSHKKPNLVKGDEGSNQGLKTKWN